MLWTPARRAAQRACINRHKPWLKSTGPRSDAGKSIASQNAYRHGYRSASHRALCALLRRQRDFVRRVLVQAKTRPVLDYHQACPAVPVLLYAGSGTMEAHDGKTYRAAQRPR